MTGTGHPLRKPPSEDYDEQLAMRERGENSAICPSLGIRRSTRSHVLAGPLRQPKSFSERGLWKK